MRRIALLLAMAALGGCVSQSVSLSKETVKAYDVFLGQPVVADTVFRDGDRLSFQLFAPKTEVNPKRIIVQMEASCSVAQLRIAYLDSPFFRDYVSRQNGVYVGARALTSSLYSGLKNNPSFVQACSDIPQPDWRIVKKDADDRWVMLDRNNIKKQGSETLFWGAFDYKKILMAAPQSAPSAQKRERYAVDCAKQTFRRLASYDVDMFNSVTDGEILRDTIAKSVVGANDDYKLLFKTLCAGTEQLKQLPTYSPRYKDLALPSPNGVDAPVLAAINVLNLQSAEKKLKYIAMGGTSTSKGVASVLYEESFLTTDPASGQVVVDLRKEAYETRKITWRGLIVLASKTNTFDQKTGIYKLKNLSFSGDWQHMPIGAVLSYSGQGHLGAPDQRSHDTKAYTVDCSVKRELNASDLNAGLTGTAKEMRCATRDKEHGGVRNIGYLVDYGYFFDMGMDKNSLFYDEIHILNVH